MAEPSNTTLKETFWDSILKSPSINRNKMLVSVSDDSAVCEREHMIQQCWTITITCQMTIRAVTLTRRYWIFLVQLIEYSQLWAYDQPVDEVLHDEIEETEGRDEWADDGVGRGQGEDEEHPAYKSSKRRNQTILRTTKSKKLTNRSCSRTWIRRCWSGARRASRPRSGQPACGSRTRTARRTCIKMSRVEIAILRS